MSYDNPANYNAPRRAAGRGVFTRACQVPNRELRLNFEADKYRFGAEWLKHNRRQLREQTATEAQERAATAQRARTQERRAQEKREKAQEDARAGVPPRSHANQGIRQHLPAKPLVHSGPPTLEDIRRAAPISPSIGADDRSPAASSSSASSSPPAAAAASSKPHSRLLNYHRQYTGHLPSADERLSLDLFSPEGRKDLDTNELLALLSDKFHQELATGDWLSKVNAELARFCARWRPLGYLDPIQLQPGTLLLLKYAILGGLQGTDVPFNGDDLRWNKWRQKDLQERAAKASAVVLPALRRISAPSEADRLAIASSLPPSARK